MFQVTIVNGSSQVQITGNSESGPFWSRLYVNSGETATLISAKHKSLGGATAWARKAVA